MGRDIIHDGSRRAREVAARKNLIRSALRGRRWKLNIGCRFESRGALAFCACADCWRGFERAEGGGTAADGGTRSFEGGCGVCGGY